MTTPSGNRNGRSRASSTGTIPPSDEFSDYPRLGTAGKKKILGLNAARLYGLEVPAECRLPEVAAEPEEAKLEPESV